jgi:hypothetical protein
VANKERKDCFPKWGSGEVAVTLFEALLEKTNYHFNLDFLKRSYE